MIKAVYRRFFVRILRRFLMNGLIMSLTSVLLRGFGVGFNAFVAGRLGADGMGLFTLIMSVYGLSVTVASSGVNLASTRMCAEALGRGDGCEVRSALKRCLIYALICGTGACLLFLIGADYISSVWLGDERCRESLRLLAVSLPFIAASNVLHGYFTAVRRVVKSAACQVFEQLFRVFVTVAALLYIVPEGIEYACMALVGGGALAETVSFIIALVLYLFDIRKVGVGKCLPTDGKRLTRTLFGITVPVAAAAYVRSGLSTLEHILIPKGLRKNPVTAESALADYGVLCGMVMPVIMFPTALLYSFTGLLVPEFAEARASEDSARIRRMTSRVLGLTLKFSIGCAVIMYLFSGELGILIYGSHDAGRYIFIMAPLIPIMYLDHAVDAMLKGLGEQLYCMKINILDSALCTLLVWLLCPRIGIYGYIVTVYAAEVMNASLSLFKLTRVTGFRANAADMYLKPMLCAVGTASIMHLLGADSLYHGWFGLVCMSLFTVAVFSLLLFGVSGAEISAFTKKTGTRMH